MSLAFERPRLASHVQARFHIAGGVEKVVLSDSRSGLVLEITPEDWRVLEAADGTRDLDALCLAATRLGIYRGEAEIRQLVAELGQAGVLVDGLPVPPAESPVELPASPPGRALETLPGYTFSCAGQGSCCRFYGSIPFTPIDALRARVHAAEGGHDIASHHLFYPVSGAQRDHPQEPVVVAQINGRCAFLNTDDRCDIHAGADAATKPIVCQLYPVVFVDDGSVVRASVAPECACVFDSAERNGGEPLLADGLVRGDLHPMVAPSVLSDPVALTPTHTAPRSELRAWSRRAHDFARAADRDAAGWALALAQGMDGGEFGSVDVPSASLRALEPWITAFRVRAASVADTQDGWRGASDLSRRVARWMADALRHADPFTAEARPRTEAFYLATLAWGHRLAAAGRPLAQGLRDRATRILTARAMLQVAAPEDIAAAHPLALVEASVRNLGIAGYADEL